MAVTKLWKVENRLDHVIDYATDKNKTKKLNSMREVLNYAMNEEKTEKQFYVTGINCDIKSAEEQMIETKKKFGKYKYSKNNSIIAFHGYQSFKGDEVSPETAHQIGVQLANEMWGDRFEVIVTTHLNTNNIHNHFVLNSVSFVDGKKYYSNFQNTALLRKTSDDICDEFGLKVLEEKRCKSGIDFNNYYKKSLRGTDYYRFAKEDIDCAIKKSFSEYDFKNILNEMGYRVKIRAGEYSIAKFPHKRVIRISRAFGTGYTFQIIKNRIYSQQPLRMYEYSDIKKTRGRFILIKGKVNPKNKVKGFRALYYYYCYLLKVYPRRSMQYKLSPYMRAEVRKMDRYSEKMRFIGKYIINDKERLNEVKSKLKNELEEYLNARDRQYYRRKRLPEEEKEKVTDLIVKTSKVINEIRHQIKICDEIEEDIPTVKKEIQEFEERQKNAKQLAKELAQKEVKQEVHKKKKRDYCR